MSDSFEIIRELLGNILDIFGTFRGYFGDIFVTLLRYF